MSNLIYNCWFYLVTIVASVIMSLASIVVSLFERRGRLGFLMCRIWAWIILFLIGIKVRVEGLDRLDPDKSYVFMANHGSMFDILVLQAHFTHNFRWLAKRFLFRIPIFGWAMSSVGNISVDRRNPRKAVKSVLAAAKVIRGGTSVMVFPEGTRSHDGRLDRFIEGGFVLAIKSGRPVVPVTILGTYAIMPRQTLRIRRGRVRIVIDEPMDTQGLRTPDKGDLAARVRGVIDGRLGFGEGG